MKRWSPTLAVCLALAACDEYEPRVLANASTATTPTATSTTGPDTVSSTPDSSTGTSTDTFTPIPVEVDPIIVDLGPDHPVVVVEPPPAPQPPTRPRRRMDIDQLDKAILSATGYAWTATVSGREVNQFAALAQTLGKPDFMETTEEDLTPSTLFQKFLDEAARTVCDRLATAESTVAEDAPSAEPSGRILFRHVQPTDTWTSSPAAIEKNLSYLLLRFHGARVATTDPALEPWRWLFRSALHVDPNPVVAWRTVCVGLIVHPAFYTY